CGVEVLVAEEDDEVVEPRLVDRLERRVVDRCEVDVVDDGAERSGERFYAHQALTSRSHECASSSYCTASGISFVIIIEPWMWPSARCIVTVTPASTSRRP